MLIYGGYQDLRGSSPELWAFHFGTRALHFASRSMNDLASSAALTLRSSNGVYRDGILAPALVERERTGREAQTFGGLAR